MRLGKKRMSMKIVKWLSLLCKLFAIAVGCFLKYPTGRNFVKNLEVQRRVEINQRKEQFSNAYLQAVASTAGYSLYKPVVDDDSVDWGIAADVE